MNQQILAPQDNLRRPAPALSPRNPYEIRIRIGPDGPSALDMALEFRNPPEGLLHHSDRGSNYTANDYRKALSDRGIETSMSRKGNCWDNAVAESFFATIKKELIQNRNWAGKPC